MLKLTPIFSDDFGVKALKVSGTQSQNMCNFQGAPLYLDGETDSREVSEEYPQLCTQQPRIRG